MMQNENQRTYENPRREMSAPLLGRMLAMITVVAVTIQWLVILASVAWLATRYELVVKWVLYRWAVVTTGKREDLQQASAVVSRGFVAIIVAMVVVFLVYLALRPVGRAITRKGCCLLIQSGQRLVVPLGVVHLLAMSKPAHGSAMRDYTGLLALQATYESLSRSKRVLLVEVVRRIEETPSPVAGDAQMFLVAIRDSHADDDAEFLMEMLNDTRKRI